MKLNFTSLQYFQKTAELEHLTKAAEALHVAQPALSRTIRGLEEELGTSLFEHQGRRIQLTRDGHILLKYANSFLISALFRLNLSSDFTTSVSPRRSMAVFRAV